MGGQVPLFEPDPGRGDRSEFIDGIMAAWDAAHPVEAVALERERLRRLEKAESDARLLIEWKRQYER